MAVRRQHVVSQTILKRWTVDGHLAAVDLTNGRASRKSPRQTGYVEWYVQADFSTALEAMWNETEARVPEMLAEIAAGTAFENGDVLEGLRQLVAVHVIRSKPMAMIWERSFRNDRSSGRIARIQEVLQDPDGRRAVYEHDTGIAVVGDVPLELVADSWLGRVAQTAGPGGLWFVENALLNYERLLEVLRSKFVQVGRHLNGGLILGDSPATTYEPNRELIGLLGGANLTESVVLMPISPEFIVSFGKTGRYVELSDRNVGVLNRIQYGSAIDWVYTRPGSSEIPLLSQAVAESIARTRQ